MTAAQMALMQEGPVRVLAVSGTLHLRDVSAVMAALAAELARGVVVCDLTGAALPGHDAMLALFPAALRRAGGWPSASLHLYVPDAALQDRMRRTRVGTFLPVHETMAGALADAEIDVLDDRLELTLPGETTSPRRARAALLRTAAERRWALDSPETAAMVVAELTAGAVRHQCRELTVDVGVSSRGLLVAVTDRTRAAPRESMDEADLLGSRLVHRLCDDWGVRLLHPAGETVWGRLLGGTTVTPRAAPGPRPGPRPGRP